MPTARELEELLLLPPQHFGVFLFMHGNETAFRHEAEREPGAL